MLDWVADHRKHHTFADQEGDPHSPHVGQAAGVRGMITGLWHAHVGWLFETNGQAEKRRYCPDLLEDPTMRQINRRFPLIVLATSAVPFAAGWAWGGSLATGSRHCVWAGLVRIFLVHHVTWSDQLDLPRLRERADSRPRIVDQRVLARAAHRSARRGTTITTRFRAPRSTAYAGTSSTPRAG